MGRAAIKFAINRLQHGKTKGAVKRYEFVDRGAQGYVVHVWLVSGEFHCCYTLDDVVALVG